MKNYYYSFFLLFLISLTTYSQNYISFPDSNARWVNYRLDNGNHPNLAIYEIYCVNGEDTLINSQAYTKVSLCGGSFPLGYFGAIRDSLGKVFFIHKDSTMEMLLYDFTLNPGDSINTIYNSPMPTAVSYIDTVLINGQQRRRIHFNNAPEWIEGIGNVSGLFRANAIPLSVNLSLQCMSHDSVIQYPLLQQGVGNCSLTVGIDESKNAVFDFSIFPNPSSDILSISISDRIESVQIFNIEGRLLAVENVTSFSIKHLTKGVYYLKVQTEKGIGFGKFIKE